MTEGTVLTVDPAALVWLQLALDFWQEQNTANATRLLRNWTKKYCAPDSPEAPDNEPEEKAEVEEE